MDQFEACLLCESHQIYSLEGYEKHKLVKCASCKFVFCKLKPTAMQLQAHYALYPRANLISGITVRRYNTLLDTFEKFRKTNNMIDVGCGDGYFLAEAAKRGWKVFGTEFTDEAIAVCEQKKINMKKGPVKPNTYSEGFFDVLTSFEVIEHINNPAEEALVYSTILRPGGVAYVTTPNFNSISRLMLGSTWNVIEYPEHLCYYTKTTLTKLFGLSGFKLSEVSTTGISFSRFKRSMKGNPAEANQTDEILREKSESKFAYVLLKRIVNYLLNLAEKGDALKATFIKR